MKSSRQKKQGWISLHRKIEYHWIWVRPDYLRAWLWLLFHANHKPNTIFTGIALVKIERGELVSSLSHLSDAFGWGIKTTRTFLNRLEKDGLIVKQSGPKWTKLTICKYDKYQDTRHDMGKQKAHKGQTEGIQGATNNNENNDNNDINRTDTSFIPPSISEITEYFKTLELKPHTTAEIEAGKFHDHYSANGWKVGGKTKMKDWRAAARGWSKRDFSTNVNTKSNFITTESDYN